MSVNLKIGLIAALGVLAASGASAQTASCLSPVQQSAFDVGALKSALSVVAVACGNEDEYNAFVETHRRELVSEDGRVNAWFKGTYGRLAQPRYDSYITLLANEQGEIGQQQGSDYCPRFKLLFSEVMAVPSASLPQYASAKDLMPSDLTPCAASMKAESSRGGSASHRATHHK